MYPNNQNVGKALLALASLEEDKKKGIEFLDKAISKFPSDSTILKNAYSLKGEFLEKIGDKEGAIKAYKKSAEIGNSDVYFSLCSALRNNAKGEKDWKEVIEYSKKGISIFNKNLKDRGEMPPSMEPWAWNETIEYENNFHSWQEAEFYYNIGLAEYNLGNLNIAEENLKIAVEKRGKMEEETSGEVNLGSILALF